MSLTIKRRLSICIEVLFARSGHSYSAQEKQLSIFKRGYEAGFKDGAYGLVKDNHEKYNELLMAVHRKHPDETRHHTALRYIINAEKGTEQNEAST